MTNVIICRRCGHKAHDPFTCDWEAGGNQWNPGAYCWCRGVPIDEPTYTDLDRLVMAIVGIFFWGAVALIAAHFAGWL